MPREASESERFRLELARVLASRTFSKADRARELLRWLVEYALSDNTAPISQYAIATEALGYPPSYDAARGGVRIAIRRLREKLAAYYATEARTNRSRILIDKEQYSPRLTTASEFELFDDPPIALALKPSARLAVLVLPFLPIGFRDEDSFCGKLTLALMRALAASGQARVVPWTTSHWIVGRTGDKREYYRMTGSDVIIEGLVHEVAAGRFTVGVHWIDALTGLFDDFFEAAGGARDSLDLVHELAIRLSQRLSITYDERDRRQVALRESSDPAAAAYYLKARDSALQFTPYGVGKALGLVQQALQRDPHFAVAHALAAEVHLGIGDAGMAPATDHAPLARIAAQKAEQLAPEMTDASAASGAVQLVYDWALDDAEPILHLSTADPLTEHAPHWLPILDIARGNPEQGAYDFEAWARLDPGSAGKAAIACEFWYYARQFDHAITWGLKALELDPNDFRAGLLLADCYSCVGQAERGLQITQRMRDLASDFAEPNFAFAAQLAKTGQHADARRVIKNWEHRRDERYVYPVMKAIAYGWLGERGRALDAMRETIAARHTVCLFARSAPYLEPLHGLAEFDRMLNEAGLTGR